MEVGTNNDRLGLRSVDPDSRMFLRKRRGGGRRSSGQGMVTGAKKVENSYSRNVKLPSAIIAVLSNIEP